ncbi:MAG: hypothetical protein QM736_10430 [Vicinamibacterales bacterium]
MANLTGCLARAMSLMPADSDVDAVTRLVRFAAFRESQMAVASALTSTPPTAATERSGANSGSM